MTSCSYDQRNRLVQTEKEAGGETLTTAYHYDPNGNMISKMPELVKDDASDPASLSFDWPEGELEPALYGYDVWNNMVSAHNSEGEHLYEYNGDGLRVSKTTGGLTTYYG